MYVREKKIRRGENTYSYWQVVRGQRVDGKVKQRVVAHVGPAEDRERADQIARAKGLLCGALECGKAATEELVLRGFRPTYTLKLPGGRTRECPFLVCAAHAAAWRNREWFRAQAFLLGEGIRG